MICAKTGKTVRNASVAVLDIRSSEICAAVGERGVNNTFIIKSKYSCAYDGYADGELLDVKSFSAAINECVKNTLAAAGCRIVRFFVGVPGEFLRVVNTDKVLSFPSPRKIRGAQIEQLKELSRPRPESGFTEVECSPVYYVMSDKRRMIDPYGCITDSLRAKLSWFFVRTAFSECVSRAFARFAGIRDITYIPSPLAEINYLLSPEIRDSYTALFDLGYISSTYSIACGNGVIFSQSFSVGIGHVAVLLSQELNIPFEVASQFLSKVNLNAKEHLTSIQEIRYEGQIYSYSTATLRDIIREGLDGICETIEACRQSFSEKDMSGKPLYITGEGVKTIRGTAEHLSSRLVCAVNVVAPTVPYYDKPQFSSLYSLLDAALGD